MQGFDDFDRLFLKLHASKRGLGTGAGKSCSNVVLHRSYTVQSACTLSADGAVLRDGAAKAAQEKQKLATAKKVHPAIQAIKHKTREERGIGLSNSLSQALGAQSALNASMVLARQSELTGGQVDCIVCSLRALKDSLAPIIRVWQPCMQPWPTCSRTSPPTASLLQL